MSDKDILYHGEPVIHFIDRVQCTQKKKKTKRHENDKISEIKSENSA